VAVDGDVVVVVVVVRCWVGAADEMFGVIFRAFDVLLCLLFACVEGVWTPIAFA